MPNSAYKFITLAIGKSFLGVKEKAGTYFTLRGGTFELRGKPDISLKRHRLVLLILNWLSANQSSGFLSALTKCQLRFIIHRGVITCLEHRLDQVS